MTLVKYILAFVCCSLTLPAVAQTETQIIFPEEEHQSQGWFDETDEMWDEIFEGDFPFEFHLLAHSGYQYSNLQTLNSALSAQGYTPNMNSNLWSAGGAMQFVAWNVIFEFDGQTALSTPVYSDKYFALLNTGNSFFNMGYQWRPWSWLRIYPIAGVGQSFAILNFSRRDVLPDFNSFLQEPGWRGNLAYNSMALNIGLGIEWENWFGRVGLRGGYIFHPLGENNWFVSTPSGDDDSINRLAPVAGGPSMRLDGPYLRFVVGF